MSQVILVGIDCSDCGNRALDYAAQKAARQNASLIVAHVIQWSPYSFNTNEENAERHKRREAEIERAHREIIDPVVARLSGQGINVEGVVRHGHVARTLKALSSELGANTIVVGRHGESSLLAQLFGSVPGTLIQISEQPVTVVP